MCPSSFPSLERFFPLKKLLSMNNGSLGTLIIKYFSETLNISLRAFAGSPRCSSTSVQIIRSKELSLYGSSYMLPCLKIKFGKIMKFDYKWLKLKLQWWWKANFPFFSNIFKQLKLISILIWFLWKFMSSAVTSIKTWIALTIIQIL